MNFLIYLTTLKYHISVIFQIVLENPLAGIMYGPVIEPPHSGALFSSYSDELLRLGGFHKVPILTGVTSNEAAAVGDIPGMFV